MKSGSWNCDEKIEKRPFLVVRARHIIRQSNRQITLGQAHTKMPILEVPLCRFPGDYVSIRIEP